MLELMIFMLLYGKIENISNTNYIIVISTLLWLIGDILWKNNEISH